MHRDAPMIKARYIHFVLLEFFVSHFIEPFK